MSVVGKFRAVVRYSVWILKMIELKMRFGARICFSKIQHICMGTEIVIKGKGKIIIGSLTTSKNVHIGTVDGLVQIGKQVYVNRNTIIACRQEIRIGDHCCIGPNCAIYDHDHVFGENGIVPEKYKCSNITIDKNCWIGAGVVILRGTHIEEGCIIGAGSIVSGHITAHSVVKPCRDVLCISITDS